MCVAPPHTGEVHERTLTKSSSGRLPGEPKGLALIHLAAWIDDETRDALPEEALRLGVAHAAGVTGIEGQDWLPARCQPVMRQHRATRMARARRGRRTRPAPPACRRRRSRPRTGARGSRCAGPGGHAHGRAGSAAAGGSEHGGRKGERKQEPAPLVSTPGRPALCGHGRRAGQGPHAASATATAEGSRPRRTPLAARAGPGRRDRRGCRRARSSRVAPGDRTSLASTPAAPRA